MDEKTQVQGLYRQEKSKALINKDNKALLAYKKRKQNARLIPTLLERVEKLEETISEMQCRLRDLENK